MKKLLLALLIGLSAAGYAQPRYWNTNTQLVPWRFPIVPSSLQMEDLDNDGDPYILKRHILDSIPFIWIDDDDDMKWSDREGDIDSDCLLIDRNKDGTFAGSWDLSLDWGDENRDGKADTYFYDARWRHLTDLYYPDRIVIPKRILTGEWNEYRMVFDEDDDCARWERVEFYDPKDIFLTGRQKGGLDHNNQADAAGDRCDFDLDGSGKGRMYLSPIDGKLHLYGAEWGVWRIDQTGFFHQGFGGLYDRWRPERLQEQPSNFPTILYVDQNGNGFADQVKYDLDGDRLFEDSVSLTPLGIVDTARLIDPRTQTQKQIEALFSSMAIKAWTAAQQAIQIAESQGGYYLLVQLLQNSALQAGALQSWFLAGVLYLSRPAPIMERTGSLQNSNHFG